MSDYVSLEHLVDRLYDAVYDGDRKAAVLIASELGWAARDFAETVPE